MKVCYFGIYDKNVPRNQIQLKRLQKGNVEVIEVNEKFKLPQKEIKNKFALFMQKLHLLIERLKVITALLIKYIGNKGYNSDVIVAGFPYDYDIFLAYILSRIGGKKFVFDPLISTYETAVLDRQAIRKNSWAARLSKFFDGIFFNLPDCLIVDTDEHGEYFKREFGIKKEIFQIVVGADEDIFSPEDLGIKNDTFIVEFHGWFIPLQGVDVIAMAAKGLDEAGIYFKIIGEGQTYDYVKSIVSEMNIRNIDFMGQRSYVEIVKAIKESEICLGIFGRTEKAGVVIPNKVFQALAMAKPVITADTRGCRHYLTDGENCLLVEPGDSESLKGAILKLKNDNQLRERIAKNGYKFYKENFSIEVTSRELIKFYNKLCGFGD